MNRISLAVWLVSLVLSGSSVLDVSETARAFRSVCGLLITSANIFAAEIIVRQQ